MLILIERVSALEYVTEHVAQGIELNENIVQVHICDHHAPDFRWDLILERLCNDCYS